MQSLARVFSDLANNASLLCTNYFVLAIMLKLILGGKVP